LDRALALGINGNPFAALGPHDTRAGRIIRAFLPSATKVELLRRPGGASRRTTAACSKTLSKKRTLSVPDLQAIERTKDPYAFGLLLGESDLFLFNEGRHFELGKCLGAQSLTVDGVSGVRFAVWAPSGL
jgi:1,4-alpha-glucan branching enzyme